jgi:hypothetical protein
MADNPILKKLKLSDQSPVLIVNAPDEYRPVMEDIAGEVHETPQGKYAFVHVFVKNAAEVSEFVPSAADSADPDGYFWVSYPKKLSKRYSPDINRDQGWEVLGQRNFEPVTQVSIDADWSALRFRPVDRIKRMTRKGALSEQGKQRIADNE